MAFNLFRSGDTWAAYEVDGVGQYKTSEEVIEAIRRIQQVDLESAREDAIVAKARLLRKQSAMEQPIIIHKVKPK